MEKDRFDIDFVQDEDDFEEEDRLDKDLASSISDFKKFKVFSQEEIDDDELLSMDKIDIINCKNAQIKKLEAEIEALLEEKDDYVDNFKETTNLLLERIKELEFNQSGERPVTAKIVNSMSRSIKTSDKTVKCPNCGDEVDSNKSIEHSLTCLRYSVKCKACGELLSESNKRTHIARFTSVESVERFIASRDFENTVLSLKHGFKVDSELSRGFRLVHYLAMNFDQNCFSVLKEKNPDFSLLNEEGQTAARICCIVGNIEMLKQMNTSLDECSKEGLTLLMTAAANGNKKICDFLLEKGADPDKKDLFGNTAAQLAIKGGHDRLSMWLFKKSRGKSTRR